MIRIPFFVAFAFTFLTAFGLVTVGFAGAAGVSPMAIVRRTWIPMIAGMVTTLVFNQIFFG